MARDGRRWAFIKFTTDNLWSPLIVSATQAWADLEHLAATDSFGKQHAAMLSAPMPVMSFDFSSLTALPPASRSVALDVPATASGVLNCVTFWWVPIGARMCPERRVGPDGAPPRWQVRA